ncbi:MAG: ADP-glyceromanno-heptose 6-epimerase [Omnitrophica WOR_2 bacterium GWA2_47_8]|nr:MAG: ADP-glyceromanno-heptose 6-epimerase [Omnitrophica WOR_2 bacterium GWA2_47_8]
MIVVTGAAGFIGSCILKAFNDLGQKDIIVVDHLGKDEKKANLKNKTYREYLDKKDFLDVVRKDSVPSGVDCIVHMGACSSTTLQDKEYFEANNFEYTRSLAEWALKHKARFIYASSAATYGDGSHGYRDDEATLKKCKPLNYYGQSKQKFDQWALDHQVLDKVVGLKFFNVFGPNEYHKADMRSVVAKSYDRVAKEGKISLFRSYRKDYADGEQKRDFIYVKDAIDIVMFFYKNPKISGIFNVGSGEARTWNDLAKALFKAVEKTPHIDYIDMPETLRLQYQYFTQADMGKLRSIGYKKPFLSLEQSIADYVPYLKEHKYI